MSSQCEIYKGRQCSCGKHHCRTSLVGQIRATAAMMQDTGAAMDYYGGLDSETAEHGREMMGAAAIADSWADFLEGGE